MISAIKGFLSVVALTAALIAAPPSLAKSDRVQALEQLAEGDNAEALYHLGMMYLTGTSVGRDQGLAVTYFERAYELGDPLLPTSWVVFMTANIGFSMSIWIALLNSS